jgi:hypothetical protein
VVTGILIGLPSFASVCNPGIAANMYISLCRHRVPRSD